MPRMEKEILTNNKFMECFKLKTCSRYLLQTKPKASCAPWSIPGELLAAFALIMIFMCLAVNTHFPSPLAAFLGWTKNFLFMHCVFQSWFVFFFSAPAVPFCLPLSLFPFSCPLQPLTHNWFPLSTYSPLLFFVQFDDFHLSSFPGIFGIESCPVKPFPLQYKLSLLQSSLLVPLSQP